MIKLKEMLNKNDRSQINYDVKEDLLYTVQGFIPNDLFPIKYGDIKSISKYFKVENTSDPMKFNVLLSVNGVKIPFSAEKIDRWRGNWNFIYDNNKISKSDLEDVIEKKLLSPAKRLEYHIKHHDLSYQYADDHRSWSSGKSHVDFMKNLYNELTREEQIKMWNIWNKEAQRKFKDGIKTFGFDTFEKFDSFMKNEITEQEEQDDYIPPEEGGSCPNCGKTTSVSYMGDEICPICKKKIICCSDCHEDCKENGCKKCQEKKVNESLYPSDRLNIIYEKLKAGSINGKGSSFTPGECEYLKAALTYYEENT